MAEDPPCRIQHYQQHGHRLASLDVTCKTKSKISQRDVEENSDNIKIIIYQQKLSLRNSVFLGNGCAEFQYPLLRIWNKNEGRDKMATTENR